MAINKAKTLASAQRHIDKGQLKRAIAQYQRLSTADPTDVKIRLRLGDLYHKTGDLALALKAYNDVAHRYSDEGYLLKSVAVFKQMLRLDTGLHTVHVQLARVYHQLGLVNDAVSQYQQAVRVLTQRGKSNEKLYVIRELLELDPENVRARVRLAEDFAAEGGTSDAVRELRLAAETLDREARTDEFILVAERLLYHEPDDTIVARRLAELLLDQEDPQRALPRLQACFRAHPHDTEILSMLARAFGQLGQAHKSLTVLKELARIHDRNGLLGERDEVLQRVLELDPSDLSARRTIGQREGEPERPEELDFSEISFDELDDIEDSPRPARASSSRPDPHRNTQITVASTASGRAGELPDSKPGVLTSARMDPPPADDPLPELGFGDTDDDHVSSLLEPVDLDDVSEDPAPPEEVEEPPSAPSHSGLSPTEFGFGDAPADDLDDVSLDALTDQLMREALRELSDSGTRARVEAVGSDRAKVPVVVVDLTDAIEEEVAAEPGTPDPVVAPGPPPVPVAAEAPPPDPEEEVEPLYEEGFAAGLLEPEAELEAEAPPELEDEAEVLLDMELDELSELDVVEVSESEDGAEIEEIEMGDLVELDMEEVVEFDEDELVEVEIEEVDEIAFELEEFELGADDLERALDEVEAMLDSDPDAAPPAELPPTAQWAPEEVVDQEPAPEPTPEPEPDSASASASTLEPTAAWDAAELAELEPEGSDSAPTVQWDAEEVGVGADEPAAEADAVTELGETPEDAPLPAQLADELREFDFYVRNGLPDAALSVLQDLPPALRDHPEVAKRLELFATT